ncbi:uncharacterized protein E6C27_scaffold908G00710 [Cucumis melo var. makuwa]|uniref:Uncharacterized protein n=1 Tax=Cucumis melo var. makuwa TaxID=1194695 RepID=A0A5A7TWJ8_CUCMM|nr:uncharacterized protein E6C27_scaffold908G00710 [Cucumis melo var. makuwa]
MGKRVQVHGDCIISLTHPLVSASYLTAVAGVQSSLLPSLRRSHPIVSPCQKSPIVAPVRLSLTVALRCCVANGYDILCCVQLILKHQRLHAVAVDYSATATVSVRFLRRCCSEEGTIHHNNCKEPTILWVLFENVRFHPFVGACPWNCGFFCCFGSGITGTYALNSMDTQYFSTPPSKGTNLKSGSISTPGSSPLLPSITRLWRPAAQRNIRNQWSKLASLKQQWASSSSSGRSHATSIVNAYLSEKYMPSMELGSLCDMIDIRNKACLKLSKQQELYRSKLLSSYKEMVDVVVQMVNTSRRMKCYFKRSSNSALIEFSTSSEDNHNEDAGDGGGISVFTLLTIPCFEKLAEELIHMFELELNLKRLLLMELLSLSSESSPKSLVWSEELYSGEFNNLRSCNLWSKETDELLHPTLKGHQSNAPIVSRNQLPNAEVLQSGDSCQPILGQYYRNALPHDTEAMELCNSSSWIDQHCRPHTETEDGL